MNPKLIGLLIRSNAKIIEALQVAHPSRDYSAHFESLRDDCINLAEQAEEMECDVTIQQQVKVAAAEGTSRAFEQLSKGVQPMIPISPAHEIKAEPLRLQDAEVGRVYLGKSENTGQQYTAVIKEVDYQMGINGKTFMFKTSMLKIEDNELTPFDRNVSEASFIKEFLRWEK